MLTQMAGVALLFCLLFTGIVMLGQDNLNQARDAGRDTVPRMEKLLNWAKLGGLASYLSFVIVCAVAAPLVTLFCVLGAAGMVGVVCLRRFVLGQWEQVMLRGFLPAVMLLCLSCQTGTGGALHLPLSTLVDGIVLALACVYIAMDAATFRPNTAPPA